MSLKLIGAGLPRTVTASLNQALEYLLGGKGHHMSVIPGHPFNLGDAWANAFKGNMPDWVEVFDDFTTAVDWPASHFWHEIGAAYPDAPILLSTRDSAETWLASLEATILPVTRKALMPDWAHGRDLVTLFERFTGTEQWDDPILLKASYDRHNAKVRENVPPERLVDWQASHGWEPICRALNVAIPDIPFPWINKRSDWG